MTCVLPHGYHLAGSSTFLLWGLLRKSELSQMRQSALQSDRTWLELVWRRRRRGLAQAPLAWVPRLPTQMMLIMASVLAIGLHQDLPSPWSKWHRRALEP